MNFVTQILRKETIMAYREPSHPPHRENPGNTSRSTANHRTSHTRQRNLHNPTHSNTSLHRITTIENEELSSEELRRLRRAEIIRKRQQEKWRQERRRRMIQEHKIQLLTGAVLLIVLTIFASVLMSGTFSPLKSSRKQKDKTTQSVKAGLYEDKNGTKYQESDGSFCKNDWREVDGAKYYFDKNGYMTTGWLELDGKEYFFDENGKYDSTKHRPMVALTFDDGPGRFTDKLLDCLEENNAKATFFMLGENVERFPDVVKRMHDSGMELGNHSYDHTILTSTTKDGVLQQMKKTNDAIEDACGVPADVMRPPGGSYNESVANLVGLPIITWSIDTRDWATRNADNTYKVIMNDVEDGSIVLMHDIHESSIEASLRLIPDLIEKGFRLVTIRQMAEQKGITLENGVDYNFFGERNQSTE